uniref:B box-type domain-containing protein n=1 Tax=Thermosphaera aggregans TaxID=54254 RepID=A0A7C2FPT0_9CREN
MNDVLHRKCEVCLVNDALYTCRLCGRAVCGEDFNVQHGVCKVCSLTLCELCGRQLSVGYCVVCGRLGCEDCMVQVSNVAYICRECFSKNRSVKTVYKFPVNSNR